jgi:hypothetical protein
MFSRSLSEELDGVVPVGIDAEGAQDGMDDRKGAQEKRLEDDATERSTSVSVSSSMGR